MLRRDLFRLSVAAVMLPLEALAVPPNYLRTGHIDPNGDIFVWTGGGLDPLLLTPREALNLPQVQAVMPADVADKLLLEMEQIRRGPSNYTVVDGSREDVMLSGRNGWIANKVLARPSFWRPGSSKRAWAAYALTQRVRSGASRSTKCAATSRFRASEHRSSAVVRREGEMRVVPDLGSVPPLAKVCGGHHHIFYF